jgi:hypothetical protein
MTLGWRNWITSKTDSKPWPMWKSWSIQYLVDNRLESPLYGASYFSLDTPLFNLSISIFGKCWNKWAYFTGITIGVPYKYYIKEGDLIYKEFCFGKITPAYSLIG